MTKEQQLLSYSRHWYFALALISALQSFACGSQQFSFTQLFLLYISRLSLDMYDVHPSSFDKPYGDVLVYGARNHRGGTHISYVELLRAA